MRRTFAVVFLLIAVAPGVIAEGKDSVSFSISRQGAYVEVTAVAKCGNCLGDSRVEVILYIDGDEVARSSGKNKAVTSRVRVDRLGWHDAHAFCSGVEPKLGGTCKVGTATF